MSQTLSQRLRIQRATALLRKTARRVYCEPKLDGSSHEPTQLRDLQGPPAEPLWPYVITAVLIWSVALAVYLAWRFFS